VFLSLALHHAFPGNTECSRQGPAVVVETDEEESKERKNFTQACWRSVSACVHPSVPDWLLIWLRDREQRTRFNLRRTWSVVWRRVRLSVTGGGSLRSREKVALGTGRPGSLHPGQPHRLPSPARICLPRPAQACQTDLHLPAYDSARMERGTGGPPWPPP
jgi:hypothetical protein